MHSSFSAPLSRKDQRITDTLFLSSVEDGDLEKIEDYLKRGANINAKDSEGLTGLHIALDNKNLQVIKLLLENGATSDIKNNSNESPLSIAQRLNEPSIIELFNLQLPAIKSIPQKSEKIGGRDQEKKKVGSAFHGHIYQLKLLMLFLHRGVLNQYSFRLGAEIEEAEKFDDLVFEYTENGRKKYRLLQAKHRLSKKTITSTDLLTNKNDDYSLVKYFFSHLRAKKKRLFKDGTIKDVIISTNISLNLSNLKENGIEVQEITSFDNIIGFRGKSKRYKFTDKLVSKLKPIIEDIYLNKQSEEDTKGNSYWPKNIILDKEIVDFLNRLVFAVDQPNEEELGQIIKDEIGQKLDLDLVTTENTYNNFFVFILNWQQGKGRERFLTCLEGVEFFEQAKRGMPLLFNIKDPVSTFTGRVQQLSDLHKALINDGESDVMQLVVISGLGGVGKSELARKYVSLYSQDYDNKVVWMNAESHSTLSESFRRLALDKLRISKKNIEGKEKDIRSVVEDVYRFFSKGKSLFIFDNAVKYKDGISEFLPYLPGNMNKPYVLITSRNQKWPENVKMLQLHIFSQTEALEVIKKSLNNKNYAQMKDIEELAKKLQFFPLALQQAVAYIRLVAHEESNVGSEFTVHDYLEKYEKKTKELLDFSFPEDSDDNYTKTTLTTWKVTLDSIKKRESGHKAIEVMNVIAYCAPENIPTDMFLGLVNDKRGLGSAFELLKQYSMIDLNQATLNIHRLVQQITRTKLKEQNRGRKVLRKSLKLFKKGHMSLKYVIHAISIWNYSSEYIELVQEFAPVSSFICCELIKSARFEEATLFGIKVSQQFKLLLPKDPTLIVALLTTMNNIGMALLKEGKYDMARQVLEPTSKMQEIIFGPCESDTLSVKCSISQTLYEQGKYDEALSGFQEAFGINKIMLGENHPDTLSTKHAMAAVLLKQGKNDQASRILQEVFETQEATVGKNDSQTLNTKNSIASALADKGNFDEALQIFEEVCDIKESKLGKNHPEVLCSKFNMSGVLWKQGKYSKALQIAEEVLTIKKGALGDNHPEVLSMYHNIIEILREQGKYDKALKMCREVLHTQERILGSEHPDVLCTQFSEACILDELVKYDEALLIYQEVLSKRKVVLGNDHPDTLIASSKIAEIFSKQGNYEEAFQYHQEVLKIQKNNLGENHPNTLATRSNIGLLLNYKKEYDRALEVLQSVLSTYETLLPGHPDTLSTRNNVALALAGLKKYDEALKIFREVLESRETNFGKYHNSTMTIRNSVAGVLFQMGKHNEALTVLRQVFKERSKVFGPEHPETVKIGEAIKSLSTAAANDLLTAVRNDDIKKLETLVQEGIDVNVKDDDNRTALHHAVSNGNIGIVNILLKNGADITQMTNKGNTPLHIATSQCQKEVVKVLLQHAKQLSPLKLKDFINAKTTAKSTTALHVAAQKNNLKIAKLLLQNGAMYNIKNLENKTPSDLIVSDEIKMVFDSVDELFKGIKKRNEKKVAHSLKKEKAVINARDANGGTALYRAVQNDLVGTAQFLLKNGADPTLVTNEGKTPLHIASFKGGNEMIEALLGTVKKDGPELSNNFTNTQTIAVGTTALHVASNVEIVKSLLQGGAIYNIKNKEGKTPLDCAKNNDIRNLLNSMDELFNGAKIGDPKLIENLFNLAEMNLFEAVRNACNDQGHTLLEVASINGHKNIVNELFKILARPGQSLQDVHLKSQFDSLKV